MSQKSYRDSLTSLNSFESITSDFGDSLLSSLQLEFSKFDITLPPVEKQANLGITAKDLEASAAVANADAIIEHLEKLEQMPVPRQVELPPVPEKKLLSFEEMLESSDTKYLSNDSFMSEEMDEFERMLHNTKTKHISATPNRMADLEPTQSVDSNVTLRRTSLMGKGKKLFSILSKPVKKSSMNGISSDDFVSTSPVTSPPPLPPRSIPSPIDSKVEKPLPTIQSPNDIISPKEIISSLLPPIVQKIESGDRKAIEQLVISTIEESIVQETPKEAPVVNIEPTVIEATLLTMEVESEKSLEIQELDTVLECGSAIDSNDSQELSLEIEAEEMETLVIELTSFDSVAVEDSKDVIKEVAQEEPEERAINEQHLEILTNQVVQESLESVKEELNEDDAQFRLQDLLAQAEQAEEEEPIIPKTPTTPKSAAGYFSLPYKHALSIETQTETNTLDFECQTLSIVTQVETQTDLEFTDMACSPISAIVTTTDAEQQTEDFELDPNSENARLKQELEEMRLMVVEAKSQTQQMKILKEAAESRFEQLARVAHKKLVRAMVQKHQ